MRLLGVWAIFLLITIGILKPVTDFGFQATQTTFHRKPRLTKRFTRSNF